LVFFDHIAIAEARLIYLETWYIHRQIKILHNIWDMIDKDMMTEC